ncbi:hypothetical protein [Pontiella sp.]|uniref:hypothetical protein n=1 Tax=Pontiella sp. TaxID=2837462 RepID=UPI003564CE93
MRIPRLEEMNSERFMQEAFDHEMRARWTKSAVLRRNIYLGLFAAGMVCTLYTAFIHWSTLCVLSLFLSTITLVITTKYDTQIHFLKILESRDRLKNVEPDYS